MGARGHLEAGQRDVGPPRAWGASYEPPPARPAAPGTRRLLLPILFPILYVLM